MPVVLTSPTLRRAQYGHKGTAAAGGAFVPRLYPPGFFAPLVCAAACLGGCGSRGSASAAPPRALRGFRSAAASRLVLVGGGFLVLAAPPLPPFSGGGVAVAAWAARPAGRALDEPPFAANGAFRRLVPAPCSLSRRFLWWSFPGACRRRLRGSPPAAAPYGARAALRQSLAARCSGGIPRGPLRQAARFCLPPLAFLRLRRNFLRFLGLFAAKPPIIARSSSPRFFAPFGLRGLTSGLFFRCWRFSPLTFPRVGGILIVLSLSSPLFAGALESVSMRRRRSVPGFPGALLFLRRSPPNPRLPPRGKERPACGYRCGGDEGPALIAFPPNATPLKAENATKHPYFVAFFGSQKIKAHAR